MLFRSSTLSPSVSTANRTFWNLSFESTSGALTVTDNRTTACTVKGNLSIGASVTLNSNSTGAWNVAGDVTNNGTIPATFVAPFTFNSPWKTSTVSGNSFTFGGGYTVDASKTLILSGTTFSVASTKTATINGTLQINQGAFPGSTGTFSYGGSGSLVYNNTSGTYGPIDVGHVYWPSSSGPANVNVLGAGGINLGVARTVSGTFQTSAGVTGANNLTLNGTCQLNSGGSLAAAPTYGSASTLLYNTGGTYGRSSEWASGATSEPANVQLSNNTTLNYPNGAGSFTHTITGNLTIDAEIGRAHV